MVVVLVVRFVGGFKCAGCFELAGCRLHGVFGLIWLVSCWFGGVFGGVMGCDCWGGVVVDFLGVLR